MGSFPLPDGTSFFQASDYVVIGLYLVAIVVMGLLFSGRQKSLEEYFHASGNIPWWAVGMSLLATSLSPISYLASPGWIYEKDSRFSIVGCLVGLALVLC